MKASSEAVAWVTVIVVDVAVVSPEDVAWTLRVPAVDIMHVKVAIPELAPLVSVAPADGQPSEVAARVTTRPSVLSPVAVLSSPDGHRVDAPPTHGMVGSGVKASLEAVA